MRVDTIDERLQLFRRMMEHAGLDPDDLPTASEAAVRAAAQRCLGCRAGEECHAWLDDVPDTQPLPGFCRNVSQFQDWVEQEIARDLAALSERIDAASRLAGAGEAHED